MFLPPLLTTPLLKIPLVLSGATFVHLATTPPTDPPKSHEVRRFEEGADTLSQYSRRSVIIFKVTLRIFSSRTLPSLTPSLALGNSLARRPLRDHPYPRRACLSRRLGNARTLRNPRPVRPQSSAPQRALPARLGAPRGRCRAAACGVPHAG